MYTVYTHIYIYIRFYMYNLGNRKNTWVKSKATNHRRAWEWQIFENSTHNKSQDWGMVQSAVQIATSNLN